MDEIKVIYVNPPVPMRNFDWCAYYDGCEEEGQRGWGSTKEEAIEDLLDISVEPMEGPDR